LEQSATATATTPIFLHCINTYNAPHQSRHHNVIVPAPPPWQPLRTTSSSRPAKQIASMAESSLQRDLEAPWPPPRVCQPRNSNHRELSRNHHLSPPLQIEGEERCSTIPVVITSEQRRFHYGSRHCSNTSLHCIYKNPSLEREHFATCQPLIGNQLINRSTGQSNSQLWSHFGQTRGGRIGNWTEIKLLIN